MKPRRRGEEGIALMSAIVLMTVMLALGLAVASTVDTQTTQSRAQRVTDGAFNLAESALNAQTFLLNSDPLLGAGWPGLGRATAPYPPCSKNSGPPKCPDDTSLLATTGTDLNGATWQTEVRDNGATSAANFYSDTTSAGQPGYDRNGDGQVWIRAKAVAMGRSRVLVALVRVESQEEDLPHVAVIAGAMDISNNGNKELLRGNGGQVAVRCKVADGGTCLGHPLQGKTNTEEKLLELLATQISGTTPTSGYTGGDGMTPAARARLKGRAVADGTYFTSCPSEAQLTAPVVYIENAIGCSYTSNSVFNSLTAPGVVVLDHATLGFGGTAEYFGVVYGANTNGLGTVVSTQGNSQIHGGVVIDGTGALEVGSSGVNIDFNLNAFRAVASYGSAGIVQNSWRELKP